MVKSASFSPIPGSPARTPGTFIISASPRIPSLPDKWPEVSSIQCRSSGFGGCSRDAGGEQVPDIGCRTFPFGEHEFKTCGPGHVGDLVRICHNGRCPVECDQPGIFPGGQERALDVHMGIDKAGNNVLSPEKSYTVFPS